MVCRQIGFIDDDPARYADGQRALDLIDRILRHDHDRYVLFVRLPAGLYRQTKMLTDSSLTQRLGDTLLGF